MKTSLYRKFFLAAFCAIAISGCATVSEDIYPRYDGMYFREVGTFTMYLMFFEGGRVINANTDGKLDYTITEWFNRNYTENQGLYSVDGKKINFFVEAEAGRVEFSGTINRGKNGEENKEKMNLLLHSLINGNRRRFKFKFLSGV